MGRASRKDSVAEQDARNVRLAKILASLLCLLGMFGLGFYLRGNDAVLERLGIDLVSRDASVNPGMTVSGSTFDGLSARVAEVEGVLAQYSLDQYVLDDATNALLAALGETAADPYLRYYDADHYATYLKDVAATYAGVGLLFAERDGHAYVVDVFAGSEADSKGVQVGDYVVLIDNDPGNDGWTATEAVKMVTREAGEQVVIKFSRPLTDGSMGGEEYTIALTCTDYEEPNVTTELVGSVGYIKLAQITRTCDALVAQAVSELTSQGALAFVLDLRDNPGGYLTQSIDVASLFLRSGVICGIQGKEGTTTRQATGSTVTDAPLVVLVNGNTAGTAEVVTAALKGNDRATVVGTTTMGRGTVQSIQALSFGGALRYTSAYYQAPDGRIFNGNGISPDIMQPVPPGEEEGSDWQKATAIETAAAMAPAQDVEETAAATGASGEAPLPAVPAPDGGAVASDGADEAAGASGAPSTSGGSATGAPAYASSARDSAAAAPSAA